MKLKNFIIGGLLVLSTFGLASCNTSNYHPLENVESSLYVKKVDNYKNDLIQGMDVSQVISLENSGVKYYNFDGEEEDVFSPEYFEKLSDIKMPATKLELLVKMLRKQINLLTKSR